MRGFVLYPAHQAFIRSPSIVAGNVSPASHYAGGDNRPWLVPLRLQRAYSSGNGCVYHGGLPADDPGHGIDRNRLSRMWVPSGGIAAVDNEGGHGKLVRGGFLRQSHPGIFQLLPLGLRVQAKLEALLDKHMHRLGASKVSLSSISSEAMWEKTGRLSAVAPELFRFRDRKDIAFLLSPTHEEEITALVSQALVSYKSLPLRLYQITRKYRDEFRPRYGLLRSREFLMKDLYSFDSSVPAAMAAYEEIREAYAAFFNELQMRVVAAKASSGDMGGNFSHEYHLPSPIGEDFVVSCDQCGYVVNEEIAESRQTSAFPDTPTMATSHGRKISEAAGIRVWRGITRDRQTLVNVWYPSVGPAGQHIDALGDNVNLHAVKKAVPDLDAGIEDPLPFWSQSVKAATVAGGASRIRLVNLVDYRVEASSVGQLGQVYAMSPVDTYPAATSIPTTIVAADPTGQPLDLVRVRSGDHCPACPSGRLKVEKTLELGHTFFLGTRYSVPLGATVTVPNSQEQPTDSCESGRSPVCQNIPLQMGCYGIGLSRIIGAVAHHMADAQGLNWPSVIAPYEVVVIPGRGKEDDAGEVYDALHSGSAEGTNAGMKKIDVLLDDRAESLPWKLKDADLVGYPVLVILGRCWGAKRVCEVQCRQLAVKEEVALADLGVFITRLLSRI